MKVKLTFDEKPISGADASSINSIEFDLHWEFSGNDYIEMMQYLGLLIFKYDIYEQLFGENK